MKGSIRLTRDQIAYIRKRGGVRVIRSALERYDAGELVIHNEDLRRNKDKVYPYPVRNLATNYPAGMIRSILSAHIRCPLDYSADIARMDAEIEAIFPRGDYLLEESVNA